MYRVLVDWNDDVYEPNYGEFYFENKEDAEYAVKRLKDDGETCVGMKEIKPWTRDQFEQSMGTIFE